MGLAKRYKPNEVEPRLQARWQEAGVYQFDPQAQGPVYSIDTPPPTVSGHLHLGHVYSYSHADFMARFWRMNGYSVFYPMGYDDNGLPTERLVERRLGIRATEVGREAFIEKCLQVSEEEEGVYEALWQRLGLSIDWRYTYRTIDDLSRRTCQLSFIDLYKKGLVYHKEAPSIWCPECGTAIAQAELADLERESVFYTLAFRLEDGETLRIATTRPELLPACVAVFVHPDDARFRALVGQRVTVPLFGQQVEVLADPGADPEKGTGVVMCCTFGDTADVEWWHTHDLPLRVVIGRDGRLTEGAGDFAGLTAAEARRQIVQALEDSGLVLGRQPIAQSVRVHERCDTPVETIVTKQWFIRLLDAKDEFLKAGEKIAWHPDHMQARYRAWVENLHWDWCISRQRYFGVPFPVWTCDGCGEVMLADEAQLPVDPLEQQPARPCACGSTSFTPERDVMDTWATSSLSPQIVGRWLTDEGLYQKVFPMSLRPQAHEIIRTWAFYTIVKSHYHFGALPWEEAAISGWGLAPEGAGKISKSRGGGPMPPQEMIELYSADAARYWAASTGFGKDSIISEEKIQAGAKLVTKLWNVARFSERFVLGWEAPTEMLPLSLADRWILSKAQRLVELATALFGDYDFAAAKSETEAFFWQALADNYLEMCKLPLYEENSPGARYALHTALLTVLKLFAPFMPYVTEEIYQALFAAGGGSIHRASWPVVDEALIDEQAEAAGDVVVDIATAVRRYKTENQLRMGAELARLQVAVQDIVLRRALCDAVADIRSVTRAERVEIVEQIDGGLTIIEDTGTMTVALVQQESTSQPKGFTMTELSKTYNPQEHEERLYTWWEEQGFFRPEKQLELGLATEDAPSFCITMPPPNVTGVLHLGHAMTAAVEDLMTRYYRMKGYQTLFLPGADHAGIATQNVVERELRKEGLARHDLGRDAFVERCWAWARQSLRVITEQHKRLGISCDWERERFTLDEDLSRAVRTAFVRLYKRGLISKGTYLVNWCPRCTSAISDLEVIPEERDSHLWHIRYPVAGDAWDGPKAEWGSGRWAEGATEFIQMATTRPETILGDTAVAVNPGDARWKHLVGKTVVLPALERRIPIIADEAVDPEFGTGAVKVTPAHDPTDNEIGIRHGLEAPNVMTDTAHINELGGPYEGQGRFECRKNIVADFEKEGLLVKVEDYHHAVGTCQRCATDIEPRISTQWFVDVKPLAEAAMQAVRDGETTIVPEREERRFFHWMEAIRPWCVSRQLWWGHRIPVWTCDDCGGQTCEMTDPTACAHCGSESIQQEEDVLDTWFSSGLWPFSTLGWPEDTPDLRRFYPTSMRETGYDILFFWVAREMMLGLGMTEKSPYTTVYLHGLVRNEEGKKISKSMENIDEYDPLNIIDKYGADALRYTLMTSSTPGLDMNLDPRRLEGARNFTNKIWQATRFVLTNVQGSQVSGSRLDLKPETLNLQLPDKWILSRLNHLVESVTRLFDTYQYGEAGRQINDFLWSEYCDWYIEACKVRLYDQAADKDTPRAVLLHVLETALRLLHPFMPFVTEALWQALPTPPQPPPLAGGEQRGGQSLMMARWPEVDEVLFDAEAETQMGLMMDLVRGFRNLRAEYDVTPGKRIPAAIAAGDAAEILQAQQAVLCSLAKLDLNQLTIQPAIEPPDQSATVVVGDVVGYLPLAALVDLDAERERLAKDLADIEGRIARSEGLLAGDFAQKAPQNIVQRERDKLADLQAEQDKLKERLAALE